MNADEQRRWRKNFSGSSNKTVLHCECGQVGLYRHTDAPEDYECVHVPQDDFDRLVVEYLQADRQAARIETLVGLLEKRQWKCDGWNPKFCEECGGRFCDDGHAPNCPLKAALEDTT